MNPAVVSKDVAPWWQSAVIYQIYPRSFQDTDGTGVGDLPGIIQRLDALVELGVDAIWLSPIFVSPMRDFGYDIADYRAVDPLFGTMADFDRLLAAAHERGLRLLLDLVPNHTSDQHPWFRESRSDRANARRDWYIWADAAEEGGPPNNWLSTFGGSAWEWDAATRQYYYHAFLKEQPDLNWRNPEVRGAMYDVMRFCFDKGVDGFRIDVLWHLIKDDRLRDNPPNPAWRPGMPDVKRLEPIYTTDRPEVHDIVRELRDVAQEYGDKLLIGEIYLPLERLVTYYGTSGEGVHLPFNFHLLTTDWRADAVADLIEESEAALPVGGWPNWVLSNHDQPRIAARVGEAQARIAAMLLLTLRGTPTIYYGDEIGVADVPIPPERARDPQWLREPGSNYNRDRARTPMQWTGGAPHAGFSAAEPWLPLASDWQARNVADMRERPASIWSLYRDLLSLRRRHPALRHGDYRQIAASRHVLCFERTHEEGSVCVLLNFSGTEQRAELPRRFCAGTVLRSASGRETRLGEQMTLPPNEGLVVSAENGG